MNAGAQPASPRHASPPRLLVMLSGGGRSLDNMLDRIADGSLHATVTGVVASRECGGVEIAQRRGIPVRIEKGDLSPARLAELAAEAGVDWVVLAGYLRKVAIPRELEGRVVNIHPALLPKFGGKGMYGHHVHEAVLAAGEQESGCTVHLCDSEYDRGEIVLQERCPVLPGDTPDTLAARVFECEKKAYPEALRRLFARSKA